MTPNSATDALKSNGNAATLAGVPVHLIPPGLGIPAPDGRTLGEVAAELIQIVATVPRTSIHRENHAVSVVWRGSEGFGKRWDVWTVEANASRPALAVCEWSIHNRSCNADPESIQRVSDVTEAAALVSGRLADVREAARAESA